MARGRKLVLITSCSPAHKKSVLTLSISLIILVFNSISVNGNALKTELDEECRQLRLTQGGSQLTKIKVPGSCSYFAYCVGSKAELGNCPKGLLFNADTQDCDLPEKVECEKVENADEACPPDHCGIFENSDTCTKFAICSEGRTIWNSECGEGTRFEDAVLACLPADQVPCPPRASFPEGRIINSEIEAELKKTKSGEYDQLCSKFWKGGINKVIHPKDCSKFFYCFDGRAKLAACPLGLLYNASTGHCDYVDNVTPCMPFSIGVWALAGPKECISRPCGIYPSADCDSYTVCKGGQGQIKKCKEGYKFDTDSGICQLSETAVCWDQPSPTQNVGFDRNVGTSNHSISRDVCPFHNKPASKPSETETNSVVLFSKSDVDFGTWSEWKNCPEGKYVNGLQNFRRMVMSEDADIVDHAGLTTIAFVCNTPEEFPGDIREIIDEVPPGLKRRPLEKMNFFKCEFGPAVGFQLNQVPSQGDGDDLATDWIKLICGCGQDAIKPYDKAEFKEVSGTRGVWSEPKICGARQSICGLSAQLHPWVENRNLEEYDNTGVNGVKLRCCDVPSPATKYSPSESLLSIATFENFGNEPSLSFQVELNVGLLYNRTGKWKKAMNFYETIGYNLNSLSHPFHKVFSEKVSCLSDSSCNFDWSAHEDERNDEAGMWGMAAISNVTVNVKKGTKVEVKQVVGVAGPYVIGTFAVKEIITVVEEGEDGVEEKETEEGRTIDLTAVVTQVEPGNIGGILNPGPITSTTFDAATCPFMPREEETVHFSDEVDGFIIASRPRKDIVSDGTWMEEDECGPGKYVVGITGHRDVVLGSGKKQVDYAGLTSIGFKCESPGLRDTEYMSFSAPGLAAWPVWNTSKWFDCDEGAAIGFEINAKQEITKEEPDDFATDNIKLHCSCGPSVVNPFDSTELDPAIQGVAHGTWRKGRYCSKKHTVCGLQTQMHTFQDEYSPMYDNTGLNEIRVKCCKVPDPTEKYLLRESRQLLVSLKPEPNKEKKPSTLLVPIGVQLNNSKTSARRMNFYESIGYPVANMRLTLKEKLKVLGKECQPQCMYHWEHYQSQILQDVETHEESVVVPDPVEEGETVEYYQVVASIGFFIVRTNKYIIVTEDSKKKREIAVTIPFEDESRKRKGSAWNSVKSLRNSEDDEEAEEKQAEVKEEEILADNEHKPGDTYEMKPGDKVDSEETDLGGGGDQDDSSDSPSIAGGRAFGLNKTMGGKKEEKREPAAVVAGDANENECQYHNLPPSESHEITEGGIILPNSPKLMEHGEWREWQYCPESQYVVGLTAYREILETGDGGVDKVGLTAIGFICQNPADANVGRKDRGLGLASEATNASQLLFSTDDLKCPRYLWKRWYFCRPGYVGIGFQTLGLEPLKELGDDIGIQNVKMFCSSGKEQGKPYDDNFFAGEKGVGASWGSKQVCKRGQAICGAQVQIQDIVREANNIDEFDNTGINNINLKCCDVPFPDTLESFNPSERRVLITDIDRREEGKTFKEYYNVTLNVGTEMSKSNVNCFYTSIGYDMTNIKDKFAKHVTTEGAVPCAAKRCDISWQGLKTEVFGQTKSVTSKHKVIGGQQIKTYQVVADAGPFLVKTNQYVQHIVNKGVKSGIGGREVGALKNKWILFEMPLSDGKSPQLKLKVFDVVAPQRFNGTTEFGDKSLAPVKETGKKKGFYDLISSPRITDNGEWQEWIQCPKGSFVAGIHAFRRVIMENGEDQLGISSVGFICTTPTGEVTRKFGFVTQNLQSRNWTAYKYTQCDAGLVTGFQLNVMKDLGPAGDDIATDNIKLFCSSSPPVFLPFNNSESHQFPGPGRGEWSKQQSCPPQTIVCAVRVQSEPYEDMGVVDLEQYDNTAINNVEMRCCRPPPLMESCNATEKKVLVGSCDNTHNENPGTCEFVSNIGYVITTSPEDKVLKTFGSLGVDIEGEVEKYGKQLMPCSGADCLYTWEAAPTEVWSKMSEEPRVIKIRGNAKVDLYQVIGECSFVQIRSNRYIINRNKQGNKTTEVWDVGGDQVKISGRSFGGSSLVSCLYHGKPAGSYVSDPDAGKDGKVIAVSASSSTKSSFFATSMFQWTNCAEGYHIVGIREKGKGFLCMDPITGSWENIGTPDESAEISRCENGAAVVGIQLKDPNGGFNLLCSYGAPLSNTDELIGEDVEEGQYCGKHMAACGIGVSDDETSFKIKCCDVEPPMDTCEPGETRHFVKNCENSNTIAEKCDLSAGIGVNLRNMDDYANQTCFYSSVGYDEITKRIPILKQKLEDYYSNSSCANCLYPWDNSKAVMWIKVSIGSHEINMNPSESAKVYQIVGTCGNLQVKTDGFIKVLQGTTGDEMEQLVFV